MELVILHLTDIHISGATDPILSKATAIAGALTSYATQASVVVIVVSGDIANTGAAAEYAAAKPFFEALKEAVAKEAKCRVEYLFAPGNHDCNFRLNNATRDNNIHAITSGTGQIDQSVIDSCIAIQHEFRSFRDEMETWKEVSDDGLWRSVSLEVDGKVVRFDALNVSWVSKKKEDKNLVFPIDRYSSKEEETSSARFTVMHHPLNWYSQATYRPIRRFLRSISSMVITGHEHEGNAGINEDQESATSAYLEGNVLQAKGSLSDTGFFVVRVDLGAMQIAIKRFDYKKQIYQPARDDSWSTFRPLPAPAKDVLILTDNFKRKLSDPGAITKQVLGENISLSDIFIFPDLQKVSDAKVRKFVDAENLAIPETIAGGVLIESDERAGTSSLLFELYRRYVDRGYAPVYIRGTSIKKGTASEFDRIVSEAVDEQYSEESAQLAKQMSRTKRILLVDNFDHSPIVDAGMRAELLAHLRKTFDYAIICVGKSFELREMLEHDVGEELAAIQHFRMQQFGFSKRAELTQRWISIGNRGTLDDGELISRCDKAERKITEAMKKGLIPSLPLYLLALLQSVESSRADLKDSGLGHYYQFLLTDALQAAGVPPAKLPSYFQYITQLAWEFHAKGASSLRYVELTKFNEEFVAVWTPMSLDATLEVLLNARILQVDGDEYSFQHRYMYYHLKGKYISDNFADEKIQAYVARCCKHLYVRDNANTILFLAHHTSDDNFLDSISKSLTELFEGFKPVTFEGDTAAINRVISEAPALDYKGGAPIENRKRRNEAQDEMERETGGHDGLVEREESTEKLSLTAQMTVLLKTTEILGQILKNQYATIKRPKKQELINEQFNGPLRAIAGFFNYLEEAPDRFVNLIKKAMEKQGKSASIEDRDTAARRVAAELAQGMTYGLLAITAQNTNSDDLTDDIYKVVEANGTKAFELIELAVLLDSAKPLPKRQLEKLYLSSKDDVVVSRLIKIMIFNRLYMFKTSETDMQWISTKLGIPLSHQHLIAYQNRGQKLLTASASG